MRLLPLRAFEDWPFLRSRGFVGLSNSWTHYWAIGSARISLGTLDGRGLAFGDVVGHSNIRAHLACDAAARLFKYLPHRENTGCTQ